MTNPLGPSDGPPAPSTLKVGEHFTWTTKNDDKSVSRIYTLLRTERPYVYDLRDAYNSAVTADGKPTRNASPFESYVDATGQLGLRRRTERKGWSEPWEPEPGEIAAIQANVARCVAQGMTQAEFNAMVDQQSHNRGQ